jgi:hypothetical protein
MTDGSRLVQRGNTFVVDIIQIRNIVDQYFDDIGVSKLSGNSHGGVTLFIGGSLQVFGFACGAALLVAFVLSLATAGGLWVQLERLMGQVQDGTFRAVDFDNFEQFF